MIKVAQDNDPAALMSLYVSFLRALYHIHQNAHWKTQGPEFYGNHLLFQRLYEATQEHVDQAAEKAVGLFGDFEDGHEQLKEVCEKFGPDKFDGDYVQAALKAEQTFLALSQTLYRQIKNLDAMSLGLDDMIMSIASAHELHVYLLKQAVK